MKRQNSLLLSTTWTKRYGTDPLVCYVNGVMLRKMNSTLMQPLCVIGAPRDSLVCTSQRFNTISDVLVILWSPSSVHKVLRMVTASLVVSKPEYDLYCVLYVCM